MKINVYPSGAQYALVAILHFFFGEGVSVETYTRPVLNADDLRVLAGALLIAAAALERGDSPETARARIENPEDPTDVILIRNVGDDRRLVLVQGEEFLLLSKYMPTMHGKYVWNATRMRTGTGTGGFAADRDSGFAAAQLEALSIRAGDQAIAELQGRLDALSVTEDEQIDPAAPEYRSTRLGGAEPSTADDDTQPLPGAATEGDIPADVIEALIVVRDSAVTNMLDRARVMTAMEDAGYLGSAVWVDENPNRYMDALNKMGRVTSRRDEPRDDFPGFPGNYF